MKQTTTNCLRKTFVEMSVDLSGEWLSTDIFSIEFNKFSPYPLMVTLNDEALTAGKKDIFEYSWSDLQTAWIELSSVDVVNSSMGQDSISITFYWE